VSDRSKIPVPSCPICGKPRSERYKPFCSKRCADIDLNRWLTGGYAIAAEEEEPAGEAAPEEGDETREGKEE
jgi:endogenous inhibitor of DNA gyrase (YacG/DUF329 family)